MLDFMRNTKHFGNALMDYAIALVIFVGVILIVTFIQRLLISKIKNPNENNKKIRFASIIHSLKQRLLPVTYTIAVYAAMSVLKVPAGISKIVDNVIIIFISFFTILFITDCVRIFSHAASLRGNSKIPQGMVSILQVLVWIFGILFIFANLGYNVSTFITGLGIGGVAIALASQAILGDLFNYFVILFDKPFQKGDLIQIDKMQGTVEYIGIKSTRLRSVSGEQLLVSNTDLTKSRLMNYKNMEKRRNLVVLGVEYSTPADKLRLLPDLIKKAVESVSDVELSRVHFASFGDYSLNFELAYFVLSNDYSDYVKTVQAVNYAILEAFNEAGVSFAFPSQTIYVPKVD